MGEQLRWGPASATTSVTTTTSVITSRVITATTIGVTVRLMKTNDKYNLQQ